MDDPQVPRLPDVRGRLLSTQIGGYTSPSRPHFLETVPVLLDELEITLVLEPAGTRSVATGPITAGLAGSSRRV
jgi:hypothetical protein